MQEDKWRTPGVARVQEEVLVIEVSWYLGIMVILHHLVMEL